MNEINVVPYIDVMLVLLVIFMVTAPLIQTGSIDLPSIGKASQPPVAPLEVVIKGDQSLALRDRSKGEAERTVNKAELTRLLQEAQKKNPQLPVVIAADKSVRYEAVLNVMDELQKQQVARIGLLVQPGK
jgi:biopolymer transport protein TolR